MKVWRLFFAMKHIIHLLFLWLFFSLQTTYAQSTLSGNIALPTDETLTLQWQERENSQQNKGIHTFVGYYQNQFVATLVIHPNKEASGSLQWEGTTYQLTGTPQGELSAKVRFHHNPNNKCGTSLQSSHTARPITSLTSIMPNDPEGILYLYRLAVLIDYHDFANTFSSDIKQVKDFLLNLEVFLNEVYVRDIGVKFSIVTDDRLIIQEATKQLYDQTSRRDIIENSTEKINELIGDKQYDLGIVIAPGTDSTLSGLAFFSGGFRLIRKGGASAIADNATIAHEIGHLFGADHTFKNAYSGNSLYTEPAYGQSLMGYSNNFPDGAFFSLPTAYQIRGGIVNRSYFKDPERTQLVNRNGNDVSNFNYAYGIKTESSFPTINRTKLQETYTIPKDTYFQFYINATNTNSIPIYYTAQLTSKAGVNDPKFLTRKGKTGKEPITFQTQYSDLGGFINYTRTNVKGEHLFWLAASNPAPQHFVNYDMVAVKVIIAEGKTFAITNGMNDEYEGGASLTLNWQVDPNFFDANSKVRILLSDDFGKTFKYTLVESTENDGSCEITLPNIEVGTVEWGKQKKIQLPAGVIKVEVIDHIAFATTNVAPYKTSNGKLVPNGGFKIKKKAELPEPKPEPKPEPQPNPLPQELEKRVVIYNGVSSANPHNYFAVEGVDVTTPIHLLIFDEMGLKVYENKDYGKNGDWFRGYANIKNFINNNKALHGTYFYIVSYSKNGKIERQNGFLYVR